MQQLDLDRPRDGSEIISTAFRTWWSHLAIFATLAALVVFPTAFLLDGLWAGQLGDAEATGSWEAVLTSNVVWNLLVTPLVTAMHVLVVLGLSRGEQPGIGRAIGESVRILPHVVVAVLLYSAAVLGGFVLLIIPGIWIAVSCYFTAQAAVVEDRRGLGALRRSREVVAGQWWRALGILIVLSLVSALLALPLGFVTQIVGAVAENGPLFVLGGAIAQTIVLSFTALAGTLLFFDLRARSGEAPQPAAGAALASPERPQPEAT